MYDHEWDIKLMKLRYAFGLIKNQCWIDRTGRCYYLDIAEFVKRHDADIGDIISVHSLIASQLCNYEREHYGDILNNLGWIPYGSLLYGSRNLNGIEASQAQLNKIVDLRKNYYEFKEN